MKTNLVNGQNGVATSAEMMCKNKFKGLMYCPTTASIMYEIGGWTLEQKQGLLDKVLRMRMRNSSAKEFVYNDIKFCFNWGVAPSTGKRIFQINAVTKMNGRFFQGSGVAFREFPNYYGISEVLNTLMRDLVADMFEVADIEKAESDRKLAEDLNSPDASEESYGFIGLEDASETCDNNMMACVDKYGQEFVDAVIKECADGVEKAVSNYDLDDTINYCVKEALGDMEYDPDEKRLVGCSLVPDLCDWDDEDEFCEYFEDTYGFDWDSCKEFYQEYCNDIWHFADEYDDRMEDALKDFDEESVFDKMPYKINYDGEYLGVYIDMDDFVNYIKKNMVFNADMAQLFKKEDLGLKLYYLLDPDNKDIEQFYKDLIDILPMVTDVKLYDDGLYFWYKDITDMTIREFYELHKNDDDCTEESINNYVGEFMSPGAVEIFNIIVEKDEDWSFYINEDGDGDLYVAGNEDCCLTYFDDNAPMVLVYGTLMDKMNEEIIKTETEIENEIEGAEYKVLDAFECRGNFDVDYDEWWDYVLGETPDWIKDKYFDKFCDVLFDYFVKFAKDYDYSVQEIDGGISLEMPDYNN